jgi:hypothetical protein
MTRAKKIRLIDTTFKDRNKIVWMTVDINDKLKNIKKEHNFAAMEDVLVYLITLEEKYREGLNK